VMLRGLRTRLGFILSLVTTERLRPCLPEVPSEEPIVNGLRSKKSSFHFVLMALNTD